MFSPSFKLPLDSVHHVMLNCARAYYLFDFSNYTVQQS